jgi:hypothetical protein
MVGGFFEAPRLDVDPDFLKPGHHRWGTHDEVDSPTQIARENLRLAHIPKGVMAWALFFLAETGPSTSLSSSSASAFTRVDVETGMVFVALGIVQVNLRRRHIQVAHPEGRRCEAGTYSSRNIFSGPRKYLSLYLYFSDSMSNP